MTYTYTDEQLNGLNQEEAVYSVDPNLAQSKEHDIITDKSDDQIKAGETNIYRTSDGQRFKILSVKNDPATGFQGMAVAPIVNGQVDTNSVAVVAAGTTPTDVNDLKGAITSINPELSSPQLAVADEFLQEVRKNYHVTQLTGYSQGAYMIKLGAKYHIPTTVFNGWFSYDTLSEDEKKYLKRNTHLFKNYRHAQDDVVQYQDGNLEGVQGRDGFGTIYWVFGSSHKIFDWQFNEQGQVIDEHGRVVITAQRLNYLETAKNSLQSLDTELASLVELRNRLKADGLSRGEQIYLDSEQALVTASAIENIATKGLDLLISLYDDAIQEAEDLWNLIVRQAYTAGPKLSESEIYSALSDVGVTRESISVSDFQRYREKKALAYELKREFEGIAQKMRSGIQKQLDQDQELARNFKQWDLMR